MNVRRRRLVSAAAALVVSCAGVAFGQSAPIPIRHVALRVDSGVVAAGAGQANPAVAVPVFSKLISVPNSQWLRLKFDQAILAGDPEQGTGSYIMMTGAGGAFQTMDARHLEDWSYSSAVFNGDSVLLEIYAYPGTGNNRVSMTTVMASEPAPGGMGPTDTICGTVDNRVQSNDPRQGRLWPIGCTAWMIDLGNCANRFLTAGHCITNGAGGVIVQFNVPLSTAGGAAVAPPPQDQFPVIPASIQSNGGLGVGNDFAQFFTGPNPVTNLQARVHMGGGAYTLAAAAPGGSGQVIRVTGYGLTTPNDPVPGGGLPLTLSLVQKTHTGPYAGLAGTNIQYAVDTTGGNSGSPVVTEANGLAIGIHTHAGCTTTGGANNGTAIQLAGLQSILTNPNGPCAPMAPGVTAKGGPFAEGGVADHFNRADGPIGSDWSAVGTANLANFTISGNRGAHTSSANEFIQNDAFVGDHRSGVVWVNAFMNGTATQYVAVATGLGGTNFIYAKVQGQTGNGNFSHVAFYNSSNSPFGSLPFTALGANEFDDGRIRLSISPDGDTASLDVDTNYDGVPEFTYSSSGVNAIAGTFGKKFGLGAFGDARFDNWNASHDGNTDNFNRTDGAMTGPWAASAGTFANFTISGNAATHTSGVADIMRYTGATADYRAKTQWVDARPGAALSYVALCAGLGGANNVFVKVQGTGDFSSIGFYQGNNGGGWAGMTGGGAFFGASSAFGAARIRLSISADGDLATLDVDTDFDGVPDQSYARGGLNGISGGFGTQFGIGSFGNPGIDNYALLNTARDDFNRANGAIGGKWAAGPTGPLTNFSIQGNQGDYTGGGAHGNMVNAGWKAATSDSRMWVDAHLDAGGGVAYVALLSGLGGTDNLFVKIQNNGGAADFDRVFFYHGPTGGAGWPGMTPATIFNDLVTPVTSARIRVTIGPDGDTVTLDIDNNFDGTADESFSRTGFSNIKAALGNRYGLGAFGPVNFDNWNATPGTSECYPDCNGVGGLTIADFGCFQTRFVAGDPYADCNGVGGLTIADFACFQTAFVAGCP